MNSEQVRECYAKKVACAIKELPSDATTSQKKVILQRILREMYAECQDTDTKDMIATVQMFPGLLLGEEAFNEEVKGVPSALQDTFAATRHGGESNSS